MPGDLRPFFEEPDWHHRFDEHVLAQGKKLSSPRFQTALHLESIEDGYLLTGRVDEHDVEINLWPESESRWEFDTSCHCDFGSCCPHAAAVLMRASRPNTLARLLRGGGTSAPPPTKVEPEIVPQSSDEKFEPSFHLEVAEEPASTRVVQLLLQALKTKRRETWLVARPVVRYGPHEFPLVKTNTEAPVQRDKAAEFRAMEQLTKLGLTNLATNPTYRFLLSLARKQASELSVEGCWFPDPHLTTPGVYWPWFRAKATRMLAEKGWEIEIDEDFGHDVHEIGDDDLEAALELAPGGWFTLSVGIDLNGERLDLLPILTGLLDSDTLDQLQELEDDDRHLIYLPKGGALQVPAGRLRSILHHLAALTNPKEPTMHPLDAAALVEEGALPIDPPASLEALRKRLAKRERKREEFLPPGGLQAELRSYQKTGVEWMDFLAAHELHGILADDMGLGKTLQTLTHILRLKENGNTLPVLVVAPTSVVPNWFSESKKFTPSLRAVILHGPKRKRLFSHIPHADLVLTSFALLQRDIEELKKHEFQLVVLDEAQHIKNPTAKVSKAACELKSRQRLCLSGTPVENNLGELWSLFRFLIPGFLGSLDRFRQNYQNPIEKEEDEERSDLLKARLGPLILRRTKDQVAKELPPKTILVHPVELTSGQRDLYETVRATMDKQVRDAIAAKGLEQSQFAILDALLKLRQICCHPSLLKLPEAEAKKTGKSAKLEYLFELLETLFAEGRRVLLFSQFTSMLELIERELESRKITYLKLTGGSKDRGGLVERFQNENIPIFLISLKAGGTGLNLTAADSVIHYDPWWNPAAENQATDRAYRIGQDKPVFVHKLICSGTVEDRIHQLQQKKSHLADTLLSGAVKSTPDAEALQDLLKPLQ
ncbi:MAG: DEAD/DEAH box helicase [Akkermansiaceae bacterium]